MQSPTTGPTVAQGRPAGLFPTIGGKYFALVVLFSMNLLNYVDRYSFFAVATQIKQDLHISITRYAYLSSSFMVVYTIVTPLVGWLGDRYSRRVLLAAGVGLWSLATVGTAFSVGFVDMFFWRALLGLGEATYGAIAPALLSDLFSPRVRGRVIGLYFLALPLGGALGSVVGGWVAGTWHWRYVFWVVGLPGLIAAAAGLLMYDPGRGASEGHPPAGKAGRPGLRDYLDLFRTPTFLYNTAGLTAVTFAMGAYAVYGPDFYQTVHHLKAAEAGIRIGAMTAVGGLIGIALGMWVPDLLRHLTRRAYLLVAFGAVVAAIPFGFTGLVDREVNHSFALMFAAMVMMAMVIGPCNTVTADVVPSNRRAAGYAVSIFFIHLLGDIPSPNVVAFVADRLAAPGVAASPLGRAFAALGAVPIHGTNLRAGMLSVVPVLGLGALFFFLGSRHLAADTDRVRAAGEPDDGPVFGH